MSEAPRIVKVKVCLVGDPGVGKTSLVRRYVTDEFNDRYLSTIGTKVTKKEVRLADSAGGVPILMDLLIWDIMGQPGFRELLRDAYFQGAKGVLAVADLTRRETLDDLEDWIDALMRTVGPVPVVVAVNKVDLVDDAAYRHAAAAFGADVFVTSAKTGANVDEAFTDLARRVFVRPTS